MNIKEQIAKDLLSITAGGEFRPAPKTPSHGQAASKAPFTAITD